VSDGQGLLTIERANNAKRMPRRIGNYSGENNMEGILTNLS